MVCSSSSNTPPPTAAPWIIGRPPRCSLCRPDPPGGVERVGYVQLLVSRHEGVPRDLRVLADAAGVPIATGERHAVLSTDEGGAWRATVRRPCGPRNGALLRSLVA